MIQIDKVLYNADQHADTSEEARNLARHNVDAASIFELQDETVRATSAENTLNDTIDTEAARRISSDTDIRNALAAHEADKNNPHSVKPEQIGLGNVTNDAQVTRGEMGTANGVATLDQDGHIPASQLSGYVDDIIEGYYYNMAFYADPGHTSLINPEMGKFYLDLSSNRSYRWSGSSYVLVASDLALGETVLSAYYGGRGKTAYDHSQSPHARVDANKVAASDTPGYINISGVDTLVYRHPDYYKASDPAALKTGRHIDGHVCQGTALNQNDVNLDKVGNFLAVSTEANQDLGPTDQLNARNNISAASTDALNSEITRATNRETSLDNTLDNVEANLKGVSYTKVNKPADSSGDEFKSVVLNWNRSEYELAGRSLVYGGVLEGWDADGDAIIIGGENNGWLHHPTMKIAVGPTNGYRLMSDSTFDLNRWISSADEFELSAFWSCDVCRSGTHDRIGGNNFYDSHATSYQWTDGVSMPNIGDNCSFSLDIYAVITPTTQHPYQGRDMLFHFDVCIYRMESGHDFCTWRGYTPTPGAAVTSNFLYGWPPHV